MLEERGDGGGAGGEFVGEPWVGATSPRSAASSLPEPDHKARQKFGRIMEDVLAVEKEEELPALLTKHIDFLLSVDVTRLTNDLIRCGMVWYMLRHGMVLYVLVSYGMVWCGAVWFGVVWYDMVWYKHGMVWHGVVR